MNYSITPDYSTDEQLTDLIGRLNSYLTDELMPYERDLGITEESALTREMLQPVWQRSHELGFYGIALPEHLGGQGITTFQLCALKEELTASGAVLAHSVLGDMGGPLRVGSIAKFATPYQLENYIQPVLRAERACCFSITEPDAGSDVRRMRTTATPDGDSFIIDGGKVFSSAAPFADFAIVVARMAGEGEVYSAFLVDLDLPGVTVREGDVPMSGQRIEGDIDFDGCRLPRANLLGEVGEGLRIGIGRITMNRLLHSPSLIGTARRAFNLSVDYARSRQVNGQPLLALQAMQHKLADMATGITAARALVMSTASLVDRGVDVSVEANMCKLFTAETCFKVADEAVQIHGKTGLTQGHPVEHIFRALRMYRVVTGTSEIHRNAIAKAFA